MLAGDSQGLSDRLDGVAQRIRAYRVKYEARHDDRAVFAFAYELITEDLARNVDPSRFQKPEWVVALDEAFVNRFARAMDAYDARTEVPPGWNFILQQLAERRTSVLEALVLGMVSHIVWDLPLALNDVTAETLPSAIADYHSVNDVLEHAISGLQRAVTRRYNPFFAWLDLLAGRQDEVLTNFGIRMGRGMAWYNAQRLRDERSRDAALESIARSPRMLARELLSPPFAPVWIAVRALRWLSSWFRRWPR